jgi:hypothetical protein
MIKEENLVYGAGSVLLNFQDESNDLESFTF